MNRKIFTYLKHKGLTDIRMVNRLFVSAFMRHHNIVPRRNALLVEHYVSVLDNEATALTEFIAQLDKCECDYSLEELTKLFEFVISPSDRKITGAIYTPDYIPTKLNQVLYYLFVLSIPALLSDIRSVSCRQPMF